MSKKLFMSTTSSVVTSVEQHTRDTIILTIRPEGEWREVRACFYLLVRVEEGAISRPYTPLSQLTATGEIELLVKIYPQDAGRDMLTPKLQGIRKGDTLFLSSPTQKVDVGELLANEHRTIFMIAGGTGVMPMVQLMEAAIREGTDKKYVLIFCNKTEEDILLRDRIEGYKKKMDLSVCYFIDKKGREEGCGGVMGKGYVEAVMKEEGVDVKDTFFLICGTPGFVSHVSGSKALKEHGGILRDIGARRESCFKF